MTNLVRIDASARPHTSSHSKQLADFFQQQWLEKHPGGQVIQHDLVELELEHINEDFINAMYTAKEERTLKQEQTLELSTHFVEELKNADTLLISTPMYNFSVPSYLKTYIDLITRKGETFRYGEHGHEGLLDVPQTVVIMASGGDYTPPNDAENFVTPYLKTMLKYNGIDAVTTIEAFGMSLGEEKRQQSLDNAEKAIQDLLA
ncbi:NAD(P)H-dependent oxidoreductase [Thiomicrorhabdus sp. ZW0627]|uniref:FMN-dependent NADH-azoreductase n=1 Tax=Thiomicrorhabdus sp. ZW0627 TaxID=3039774 RepID=UPI00243644CC|nr:NAD(P)H-dependent oxidoreductase [Thiomicrorhabdus sp. ZW0627]MDG6773959.1 NAD(P)H-dependent oxidoreductase [Thiomicrorhabdus sp. ZW0627]